MIRVDFLNGKFVATLKIEARNMVRDAGFVWNPTEKKYESHDAKAAYRLYPYLTTQAIGAVERQLGLKPLPFNADGLSWPKDKAPFQHQIDGALWCLTRRVSYLAFEQGLGKTAIAVLCMDQTKGKTLVICPSFLKYTWEKEIKAWSTRPRKIQIFKAILDNIDEDADTYIFPSSLLHVDRLRNELLKITDLFWLFIDEAHFFKNPEAKRVQSLIGGKTTVENRNKKWEGIVFKAQRVVALSGTPMPNGRPIELFALTRKIAPHAVNFYDKFNYGLKYCAAYEGEWGWDFSGASNLEELNQVLTRNFMLVKKLDECVDLPPQLPNEFIYLDDDRTAAMKKDEAATLSKIGIEKLIALEMGRDEEFAERVHDSIKSGKDFSLAYLVEIRKKTGLRKVKQAEKIIKELIESEPALLVFAWHKEVVESLRLGLIDFEPLTITGETPQEKRQQYVDAFQSGKSKILIANIQAAGVGLTLTKAARVLFVEPSWTASDNEQAISRVRRIGQTRPVQASFLVWENSIDHMILNAHMLKSGRAERVIK